MTERIETSLWVERYRPRTIADCILPAKVKNGFAKVVASGDIPNFLLYGPAGTLHAPVCVVRCKAPSHQDLPELMGHRLVGCAGYVRAHCTDGLGYQYGRRLHGQIYERL